VFLLLKIPSTRAAPIPKAALVLSSAARSPRTRLSDYSRVDQNQTTEKTDDRRPPVQHQSSPVQHRHKHIIVTIHSFISCPCSLFILLLAPTGHSNTLFIPHRPVRIYNSFHQLEQHRSVRRHFPNVVVIRVGCASHRYSPSVGSARGKIGRAPSAKQGISFQPQRLPTLSCTCTPIVTRRLSYNHPICNRTQDIRFNRRVY